MEKDLLISDAVITGPLVAKTYKYYRQFVNQRVQRPVSFKMVQALQLYQRHQAVFDKFAKVFSKYKQPIDEYIRYLVNVQKITEATIEDIVDSHKFYDFCVDQEIKQQRAKIFQYFKKTAYAIAEDCVQLGYMTTIDYLKWLIQSKKLAQYYFSGKLSKYYLAALPSFPKIVSKLDVLSQEEFSSLCNSYEKYNIDIREAMRQEQKKVFSVLKYTDNLIYELQQKSKIFLKHDYA